MAILLLFNDTDTLSFKEIQAALELNENDLKRNLQSLACAKYKILIKNPKGRDVEEGDTFTFNSAFSAPLTKLKIQMVATKVENEQESQETQEKVEEDRKHQIEACIVRSQSTCKPRLQLLLRPMIQIFLDNFKKPGKPIPFQCR
jgi:cullin 3